MENKEFFEFLKEILNVCKDCHLDNYDCLGTCCRFYEIDSKAREILRKEFNNGIKNKLAKNEKNGITN